MILRERHIVCGSRRRSMATTSLEIKKHFRKLRDPRRKHGQLHRLLDLVVIAIAAVTGGADTWERTGRLWPTA